MYSIRGRTKDVSRLIIKLCDDCLFSGANQGRSQDFGEGGAEYERAKRARKFWPRPLTKWKGRSSNYHRERVLTVASELESTF